MSEIKNTIVKLGDVEYDLSLDFYIVREVDKWNFSSLPEKPKSLLEISSTEDILKNLFQPSVAIALAVAVLTEKCGRRAECVENFEEDFLSKLDSSEKVEAVCQALRNAVKNFSSSLRGLIGCMEAAVKEAVKTESELEGEREKLMVTSARQVILSRHEKMASGRVGGSASGGLAESSDGGGETLKI